MARYVLGAVGAVVGAYFGNAALGWQVGFAVGTLIDPDHINGPRLNESAVQTSRDGVPIGIYWGLFAMAGNIIQINPEVITTSKVSAGKGGPTTTEDRVTRTFAIGLGRGPIGPIAGLIRVWENDKLIYDNRESPTLPAADNSAFLEGVTLYLGTEEQGPDPELEAVAGVGLQPSYRGLGYLVFNNKDLTDFGGAIPQYRFEIFADGFLPTSSVGTSATQDGWNGRVDSTHPLDGESYAAFTMSCGFKVDVEPVTASTSWSWVLNTGILSGSGLKVRMVFDGYVRIFATLPSGFAKCAINRNASAIEGGDHTLWKFNHWYVVTMSFSIAEGKYQVSFINLSIGDEFTVDMVGPSPTNLSFVGSTGTARSLFYYACELITLGSPDVIRAPMQGQTSFIYMHEAWIDLDVEANRRKFSSLTGQIPFGSQGQNPQGTQALIYLPDGHPHINLGSKDVGTWDADFFFNPAVVAGSLPPTGDFAPTVGSITTQLCNFVDLTSVDTSVVDDTAIRGFGVSGGYSAADSIRALQRSYFFDMVNIDGILTAVARGGAIVATINRTDMVAGQEAVFDNTRELAREYPGKLHLGFASAETDYTPTKVTSERRSGDVQGRIQLAIEIPVNLVADEAAQKADIMHKIAWAEFEGDIDVGVWESFAKLVPSDPISVEVFDGVYKRFRVQKTDTVDGVVQTTAVIDRVSAYSSAVTAAPLFVPSTPTTNLPGATTWHVLDLPALLQSQDTLHLYFTGHGAADTVWSGATIEQLIENEWVERAVMTFPSTMGTLQETLPTHAAGLDDTNTILVSLSDDDIASISQAEFELGGNAALVGDEIVNFRTVVQDGDNFRLSHLGRGGLETTPAEHLSGVRFILLVAPTLVTMPTTTIGETITFRVYSHGTLPAFTDEQSIAFVGNSQIEFAPLAATSDLISTDWLFDWQHNKRIGAPNDAVISQHFTGFGIQLVKGGTTVTLEYPDGGITYTEAEQISDFGAAVASWDSAVVYGINEYTGNGSTSALSNIEGDKLAFEDGSGYLEFEDKTGVLLLE